MARKVLKVLLAVGTAITLIAFAARLLRWFKGRQKSDLQPKKSATKSLEKAAYKQQSVNLRNKSPNTSRVLIASGCACLLVAGGVGAYSLVDDYLAEQRSQDVLEQLLVSVDVQLDAQDFASSEPKENSTPPTAAPLFETLFWTEPASDVSDTNDVQIPDEQTSDILPPAETPKPVYDALGVLSITKFGLKLPVLTECTDSLLKVSPCRYLGSAEGKPERLVIAGHNYKSHFGKLSKLASGDEVRFTSFDGAEHIYTVSEITVISMDDHKALMQGEWDITLFTCTSDRVRRVLVRCVEKEKE